MPGSKLYPILGVRTAQVFTVSLSWVRPKANGGRLGHVSHPLQLPPVSTRSLTSWILPMENGWPELACRMLEWGKGQLHPCMKQNRKDRVPVRAHRCDGR